MVVIDRVLENVNHLFLCFQICILINFQAWSVYLEEENGFAVALSLLIVQLHV